MCVQALGTKNMKGSRRKVLNKHTHSPAYACHETGPQTLEAPLLVCVYMYIRYIQRYTSTLGYAYPTPQFETCRHYCYHDDHHDHVDGDGGGDDDDDDDDEEEEEEEDDGDGDGDGDGDDNDDVDVYDYASGYAWDGAGSGAGGAAGGAGAGAGAGAGGRPQTSGRTCVPQPNLGLPESASNMIVGSDF